MLKIVHLQSLVSHHGNAPFRLHEAMLNFGIDSKMIAYNTPRAQSSKLYRYSGFVKILKSQIYYKVQKYIESKKKRDTYLFSYPKFIGNNVSNHSMIKEADVIYLHWIVGGFLNFKNIEQILDTGKPVVFFMHDMWTITGGCHHSFECNNYKINCEHCPIFKNDSRYTLASEEFKIKKEIFSKFNNVYFLSPSEWLLSCAKESGLLINKSIFHIPNIIDQELFKPFNKTIAKQILNIDQDVLTISFGCVAGKNNIFKGWQYLEKALNLIYKENDKLKIELVIFGSEYDQSTVDALPYPIKFMGQINDETTMVVLNNATDLFVSPSLAESFGLTFLENIMCGTPVVGFDVGGVPEIIEHKVNGYLAEYKSSEDLARGIIFCLTNQMIIKTPRQYFTDETINKHLNFINSILQTKK